MGTTPNYQIPYPEPTDPPKIAEHLKNIALKLDSALKARSDALGTSFSTLSTQMAQYRSDINAAVAKNLTDLQALLDSFKTPLQTEMAAIKALVQQTPVANPIKLAGAVTDFVTPGAGFKVTAVEAVRAGNTVALWINFTKDVAQAADADGDIGNWLVATIKTPKLPMPLNHAPASMVGSGFLLGGYINTSGQLRIEAISPNVAITANRAFSMAVRYFCNPTAP